MMNNSNKFDQNIQAGMMKSQHSRAFLHQPQSIKGPRGMQVDHQFHQHHHISQHFAGADHKPGNLSILLFIFPFHIFTYVTCFSCLTVCNMAAVQQQQQPQAITATINARSAAELYMSPDEYKFRQLPCRTFISVGTCPYRERCTSPRVHL